MKKRNLLVALAMTLVMLFTACGTTESNPLVGKWTGTLDLTDYIVQTMVAEDASVEKYAQFSDLTFTFVFEFTEDEVSLHVDEASTTAFITNVKAGVADMIDAMVSDVAAENDVNVEDIYAGMGVTRDSYVQSVVDGMNLDVMIGSMAEALELSGTYEADGETILVVYEDNTYEEMTYAFEGDNLVITLSDGTNSYTISCTKAK